MPFKPIYEQTISVDGSTTWQKVKGACWVSLSGTFGGGTATIERKNGSAAAVAIAGEAHTVAADRLIDFPAQSINEVRVTVAGSSSPALVCSLQWSSPFNDLR
jgi:hypothetical protein